MVGFISAVDESGNETHICKKDIAVWRYKEGLDGPKDTRFKHGFTTKCAVIEVTMRFGHTYTFYGMAALSMRKKIEG